MRRVAAIVALLLVLLLVAAASVREVRDLVLYTVAPATARDANFVRYSKGPAAVLLLGTIHGRHLTTPAFGLGHLRAVLANAAPAVLLVEARPAELARGRWGDGPLEMPFAALWGRALGLRVDGIDGWSPELQGARRTDDTRDDQLFQNLLERLPADGEALVLVGFSHVPELAGRLEAAGFVEGGLPDERKAALFAGALAPPPWPPGLAEALRQRIADAEAEAITAPTGLADRLRAVAASRRALLAVVERAGEAAPVPRALQGARDDVR